MTLKLLDLFCKAGGCTMGYEQAGFDTLGVDIEDQPRYPFDFMQADVFALPLEFFDQFDVIHASPPCQAYSTITGPARLKGKVYPDLLAPTRALLTRIGKPWIIENVLQAPVHSGIILCGSMFGLQVRRHRHFETSHMIFAPSGCMHNDDFVSIYGGDVVRNKANPAYTGVGCGVRHNLTIKHTFQEGCDAMDIHWMNPYELSEAIPPAYTRYVGEQYMQILFAEKIV